MAQPWYKNGLRFTCTQCGHCCTGAPGYVWVTDDEVAAIARFREESVESVTAIYTRKVEPRRSLREKNNGDCIFYDKKKGCTVYPARPAQCRTWPFWNSNLESTADWKRTCASCPGSGQGELISAEEIAKRLNEVRI
jgi:Fe-S-cluster containining protein